LFSVAANYSISVIVPDPNKPILNYKVCESRPGQWKTIAVFALCLYQGALILAAFSLGYRLRNVPLSLFNESKVIGFSMYNVGFFAVLLLILELVLGNSERTILFLARSFLVMSASLITVGTLMSHKLYMQYFKDVGPGGLTATEFRNRTTDSQLLTTIEDHSAAGPVVPGPDTVSELEAENKELRKIFSNLKTNCKSQ